MVGEYPPDHAQSSEFNEHFSPRALPTTVRHFFSRLTKFEPLPGPLDQRADYMEEVFVATGEAGGFMIAHPPATPRDLLNIVDFPIPELQCRGRFRTSNLAKTLRENLQD